MLKLLLVHNYYKSTNIGGEDVVFNSELELLRNKLGERNVIAYHVSNEEMNLFTTLLNAIFSFKHYFKIKKIIKKNKIDLVHVHNFFPKLSPSVFIAAKHANVKVVHTLHNYRLWCISGTFFRGNSICEDCVGKTIPFKGVINKCYRNSYFQSLVTQSLFWFYKSSNYFESIDFFFVLTEFQRNKVLNLGINRHKIFLKPNAVPFFKQTDVSSRRGYIYIGRFEKSKGVENLLEQWVKLDSKFHLTLVGNGVDFIECKRKYSRANIIFMGKCNRSETQKILSNHKYLIQPSLWYETFGLTILEAMSKGVPVIGTNIGTRKEFIKDNINGFLYDNNNFNEVIQNSYNFDKYDILSNNSSLTSKKFLSDTIMEKQIEIYSKIISPNV